MSSLRSALRSIVASPATLAAAGGAVLVEGAVRALLGVFVSPVAALVAPPVAAVVGLGAVAPAVRHSLSDGPRVAVRLSIPRARLRSLVGLAVVGHALALGVGVCAFLLVDTPVRAALYWLGEAGALTPAVVVLTPLPGVAAGTALGWALPAVGFERLAAGDSLRDALAVSVRAPLDAPRRVAAAVAAHLGWTALGGAFVAAAALLALSVRSPVIPLAVGSGALFLVSTTAVAALFVFHLDRPPGPSPTPREGASLARVALVVLVLCLVVGAGAVRAAELRPAAADPQPLPDDPDALYATALDNTAASSYRHRITVSPESDEPFVVEHRLDRRDRQYRQSFAGAAQGRPVYADMGVGSPPVEGFGPFALGTRTAADGRRVRATPAYVRWESEFRWRDGGDFAPPTPVEGWRVVERSEDRLVLSLTDPARVFEATQGRRPDRLTNVSAARVRVVVDPRTRTVESVESRLDADVVVDGTSGHVDAHVVHAFDTGIDVRRPDFVGPRTAGQWVWTLFAY